MSILGKKTLKLSLFLVALFLAAAVYVGGGLRSFQLYQQAYALSGQGACGAEFHWEINPQALSATHGNQQELVTGFYSNLSSLLTVHYRSSTPQRITLIPPDHSRTILRTRSARGTPTQLPRVSPSEATCEKRPDRKNPRLATGCSRPSLAIMMGYAVIGAIPSSDRRIVSGA